MGMIADYRFQIAELFFVLVLIIDFYRNRQLNLISTKLFQASSLLVGITLIFDILSYASIRQTHYSDLDFLTIRTFYVLFLSSMFSITTYTLCICAFRNNPNNSYENITFIDLKRSQRLRNYQIVLYTVPFIVCFIGSFKASFGIIYENGDAYTFGPAAYFLYAGCAFYLTLIFVSSFFFRKLLGKRKAISLRSMCAIWVLALIIQIFSTTRLILGLGIAATLFLLYFAFENPILYYSSTLGLYNRFAFESFFYEECNIPGKKGFYIVVIVVEDAYEIIDSLNKNRYQQILTELGLRLNKYGNDKVFKIAENALAIRIRHDGEVLKTNLEHIEKDMKEMVSLTDTKVRVNTHALVYECPEFVCNSSVLLELVSIDDKPDKGYYKMATNELIDRSSRNSKLIAMLREAVDNDVLDVYYQPIYSVAEKKFISAEALVRLKDTETLGYVSPEEFVPLAEQNSLIEKLGNIVFMDTLDTIEKVRIKNIPLEYVEVNLSVLQIVNDNVPQSFLKELRARNINPSMLNFEITESVAGESKALITHNMNTFRRAGCSFSMDDFGTGYSNLSSMTSFPYDIIKLDKSLIWPCFEEGGEKAKILLKGIIGMIQNLGIKIVAEGIETKEMVDWLTDNKVDYLQGYYFSKPVPKDQYIEFLNKNNKK